MKAPETPDNTELNSESVQALTNLPGYNPEIGNESGINYHSVEIKSHSFSVRSPRFLAGENIIFDPGAGTGDSD